MMNDKLCKIIDVFEENGMYDDIYLQWAEDHDGNYYAIVDSNSDENKFVNFVQETVDIEDNIERDLELEIVYSDEYTTCTDCGKIIRTSPDSYSWQPDFYVGDGFIVCNVCFNDEEDYQEAYIKDKINNPKSAINGLVTEKQLEELGFEKIGEEYEDGWYHVNDDPEAIYNRLSERFEEVVFLISNVEQFRINFVTFVRGEI
jgi:hypothetical protein